MNTPSESLQETETPGHQTTENEPRRPRRWRRPQFSLLSLILFLTIGALLAGLYASWTRIRRAEEEAAALRTEIQTYRKEMGYLDISDPDKVYAIGLRETGTLKWGWRVYLPKNRQFSLGLASNRIPPNGTGNDGIVMPYSSGEFLLYASVQKASDGRWVFTIDGPGGSGGMGIAGSWPEEDHSHYSIGGVRPQEPQTSEPKKPLVLLRLRVHDVVRKNPDGTPAAWSAPKGNADGVMVWIQEANSKP